MKNGNVLEIFAEYKPSPRESNLLQEVRNPPTKTFCPKCTLGLDIKHTDVLILSQYCRSDGTMLPRRITKLCATQQKNIGTMVLMARRAGKTFRLYNEKHGKNAHNVTSNKVFHNQCEIVSSNYFYFISGLLALKAQRESKKKDKCWGYKGLNHYYDERTIRYGKKPINVYPKTITNRLVGL